MNLQKINKRKLRVVSIDGIAQASYVGDPITVAVDKNGDFWRDPSGNSIKAAPKGMKLAKVLFT